MVLQLCLFHSTRTKILTSTLQYKESMLLFYNRNEMDMSQVCCLDSGPGPMSPRYLYYYY